MKTIRWPHRSLGLFLAGFLALWACLGLGSAPGEEERGGKAPRTVLLLRHAEKAPEGGADPRLSSEGEQRARALVGLLGEAGVGYLFASQYQRTQLTLAPLAEELGLEVQGYDAGKPEDLLAALGSLPGGSVAVVAGHSNTTPQLVAALGGEAKDLDARGYLPDAAYDRLFVLTVFEGKTATLELRFGD